MPLFSPSHLSPSLSSPSPLSFVSSWAQSPIYIITSSSIIPSVLYCPSDGQWYSTTPNNTIYGTCYKGTVRGTYIYSLYFCILSLFLLASRLCKGNGQWDRIFCETNSKFTDILETVSA